MKITIIAVGDIKEKYLEEAIKEYTKRLGRYCTLNIITVLDVACDKKTIHKALAAEGTKILEVLPQNAYKIALCIEGTQLSSVDFAAKIAEVKSYHSSHIVFIVGGSVGLSSAVLASCDYLLSFSKMTFPHQLFRLMLLEQIYRSFKINNNETYHK